MHKTNCLQSIEHVSTYGKYSVAYILRKAPVIIAIIGLLSMLVCMRGSRMFCWGVQLWKRFLVDEGRGDPNTTISGNNRPTSVDGPALNAGLVALWFFRGSVPIKLRNRIFLWFFKGGDQTPCPPLWIRAWSGIMKRGVLLKLIGSFAWLSLPLTYQSFNINNVYWSQYLQSLICTQVIQ